jgi:HAMP domain-containing protein/signal transduction histidine kinase/CheY-like chemotaxis protein
MKTNPSPFLVTKQTGSRFNGEDHVELRQLLTVLTAFKRGDFSVRLPEDWTGLAGKVADTFNDVIATNQRMSRELERISRVVGKEGRITQRASLGDVSECWADSIGSVNALIGDLVHPTSEMARVIGAVAMGDLSKTMATEIEGRPLEGEFLRTAKTVNRMVDQLGAFASEVTRVAREVGTEGKLGGQGKVKGLAGTWKDLTKNVNLMAGNLTAQVRNIAAVTTAVANGNLRKKITADVKGEFLELKDTVNVMVDQLRSFASEVTRVAREVGSEGILGGQARVEGVSGTWKDLTDSVNFMARNLTGQVRNIANVTTAVARGDLSKKITVDVKGEIRELKDTINTMVDQLGSFASEVTRVAREVGTEGRLGGQADVKGVAGTWKDLTDSVNSMARNLTGQVRNIAEVTTAVANGNLSKKITVDVRGEILELKNTINTMVDQLRSFASEVTRVAREVGTEGKLGGQADVKGVAGTWKDLTENVNLMAGNLTAQVRNIAEVTTAIANGNLLRKITVDVKGEILEMKNTINTLVDRLGSFASEVTRVAREVGSEGKLGGQADVRGVAGTWKDLTDSVNFMAGNLTGQVRNIADVTTAVARGDLSKKITVDVKGEILELKNTINTMVDQLSSFASEVTRVAREVGTEGRLGGQADVRGVAGTWKDLTDSVNSMARNLTAQVRNIAEVTTAVANGDLSKKITVDVKGEILELKNTVNTMVDQLNSFASEVTRVAREVGTEAKLGGQAMVKGVGGTWKDLTDSVNSMASNLTAQVRGIARVVSAVANGDLKQKLLVEAKGEIAALADTINSMIDTLATFADQVTTVAREVGVEGKLGGQAYVPGAAGTWRDLTDNVNQLAANLTSQLRAIVDVATAVTKGDLSRSIQVAAQGEVAFVKDNINEMIRNLSDTTSRNEEQVWLKTNLTKFTRMLQGQRDLLTVGRLILSELAPVVSAQQGVFYMMDRGAGEPELKLLASYAHRNRKGLNSRYKLGEGLVGQAALEKERILLTNVPDDYVRISSGLGETRPMNIVVLPVLFEGQVKAVMELSSIDRFSPTHQAFLDQLTESIGIVLNTIEANTRTEDLLKQSQSLASELQSRQDELQTTNQELEEKARQLVEQNVEVEKKNREVEQARQALEGKAQQLSLTSRYKSEFLANMSHELRTPLNSLLILAEQLTSNPEGNLTPKQIEFAQTIQSSGQDLHKLINDILDLSKIESGTVTLDVGEVRFQEMQQNLERTFGHVAQAKDLLFDIEIDSSMPSAISTDAQRLDQVLKNLLSNAFKFTERGYVKLRVAPAAAGWSLENSSLNRARRVFAFSASDSGIGIPAEKQLTIFEAFQQADGSTNRRYGGTGLGLAISRELAQLLGGEIKLESNEGRGSTFTLFLPDAYSTRGSEKVAASKPESATAERRNNRAQPVLPFTDVLIADDRENISPGDESILIVEDDCDFAQWLLDSAHAAGFKAIVTPRGHTARPLIREFAPAAITLEINLPDMDGWKILERLKADLTTRHVPVIIIAADESGPQNALKYGAIAVFRKPIDAQATKRLFAKVRAMSEAKTTKLLVIEDDATQRCSIRELVGNGTVELIEAATAGEARAALREQKIDCAVLDLMLPDVSGFDLIEQIRGEHPQLPVIVYTGKDLSPNEEERLNRVAQTVIIKDVRSPERLYDQIALWLHRDVAKLPREKRDLLRRLHSPDEILTGKKVLIIDDDTRNIFAMTSLLERYKMDVISAETGKAGIESLGSAPDVDLVLMDIMLPEMDGYDTIRAIRKMYGFKQLPIIALTAKAMRGDREKCIDAGASDYIAKPVEIEQLLTLLRNWIHR